MTVELQASRTYPGGVARAFDRVLPAPLPYVLERRYLAIPPVTEVRGADDHWGSAGQTRTIVLADRSTMLETLTEVDRPHGFRYRIAEVTGPMSLVVDHLDGAFRFEPAGNGVRVTWSWSVHPHGPVGRAVMPAFARMWRGYARQLLEQMETLLAHERH